MSLLQNICDAIWTAETRTLLEGTPLADPANLLEEICDACWTETTRVIETPIPETTTGIININKGLTYRYNTTPILGALASRRA